LRFSEKKIKDKDDLDFLTFQDYFDSSLDEVEWKTVHLLDPPDESDNKIIYSFLVEMSNLNKIKNYVGNIGYPIHQIDFHKITKLDYITNYRFVISDDNEFLALPFIIYRDKSGKYPAQVDIIQDFILYHDLRLTSENKYVNPENNEEVIRFGRNFQVDIKSWYLREFLSATKMALLRCIVFQRERNKPFIEIYAENTLQKTFSSKGNAYYLVASKGQYLNSISTLYGNEIVRPFRKPSHKNYSRLFGKNTKKYLSFIVKINNNGKEILNSCDPRRAPFATCYFEKKVLDIYKKNEDNYLIENNVIYDNYGGWHIKFGINKDKIVHVLLKSLGKIPIEEQYHWKKYNIKPRGGWSKDFFDNRMNLKFTDEAPTFLKNRLVINDLFDKTYGFKLFTELVGEDAYIPQTILPMLLREQQSEFDEEVVKLSKLMIDYIDKKSLEKNTVWRPINDNEDKSLHYFEHFLKEKFNEDIIISEIISRLRLIQRIRSGHGGAHKKSSNYKRNIMKELGVETFDLPLIYEKLIGEMNRSTNYLISLIKEYNSMSK